MLNVLDGIGETSVGFLHYIEPRLKVFIRRNRESDSATLTHLGGEGWVRPFRRHGNAVEFL